MVQPNIRICDLPDGVQPLFLGGLLGFELGLLLRIGFRGDLLIKLSELSVELFFEGGLAGVGFRIGLLPSGILNGFDLLVYSIETAFDAAHFVTRHVTDLVPLLLNGGESLTGLLGLFFALDGNQRLGLDQQLFLLGKIFLLGELI